MKVFILRVLCFIAIYFLVILAVLCLIDFSGMTDYAYKRFTSGKQTSLIIGTSRAAQGIQPQVINTFFSNREFSLPIYNFSFTIGDSPFGEIYSNAIKKKIVSNERKSLFIIAVDPWSLSLIDDELSKNARLREYDNCLNLIYLINSKPNLEYLFRYFHPSIDPTWFSVFYKSRKGHLNDDGWYEVNYKMNPSNVKKNIKDKLMVYYQYRTQKSEYRINSLEVLIAYLKNYGSVYLCRMPVSAEMFLLEDEMWKGFDDDLLDIADRHSVAYFSFRKDYKRFRTIDGNHLYKNDGAVFTKDLCYLIQQHRLNIRY